MYLANLKLWNFRKFGSDVELDPHNPPHLNLNFNKGLNVLVGENDSGKTAIIDAIKMVLRTHSFEWIQISEDDFYKDSSRFRIELVFEDFKDDEGKHFTERLGWIGTGKDAQPYLRLIYDVSRKGEKIHPSDVMAGVDDEGAPLSAEARDYLKATYLKPLRDATTELISKRNSRLSQILFGHEAFKGKEKNHYLTQRFVDFNVDIEGYFKGEGKDKDGKVSPLEDQNGKVLKAKIDEYIRAFYDPTKETQITAAQGSLKSILEKLELSLSDEINPGLGTLNRLFIASELLHLTKTNWDGIRLGLIEELEAHLHPQAQMRIIEALQNDKNIQIILTTHSPNLASKVKLENLIVCHNSLAYPMRKGLTKLEPANYVFLEKFLDVTKANLFFARGVIMVEGWAEEILLSAVARKMKIQKMVDNDLTGASVSVINVGNIGLFHYAKIFLRKEDPLMNIPVAIITDVDVPHYEKINVAEKGGKPDYEYRKLDENAVSKSTGAKILELQKKYDEHPVKVFIAPDWTLEYSLFKSASLKSCFQTVVKAIHSEIDESNFDHELAKKLLIGDLGKTAIAYKLAQKLEEDNQKSQPEIQLDKNDPAIKYIMDAIKYACAN